MTYLVGIPRQFQSAGQYERELDREVLADEQDMLKKVAKVAARRLTPIETHSICVLLSMAFGRGTLQSRIFAWHVNAARRGLGLPQMTHAAAGSPTMEEKSGFDASPLDTRFGNYGTGDPLVEPLIRGRYS